MEVGKSLLLEYLMQKRVRESYIFQIIIVKTKLKALVMI